MKIDLMDIDKFVTINDLRPITDPIFLDFTGSPTENGLFSYNIFGKPGSNERKNQFAYINLRNFFFHPIVYKILISLQKSIDFCISGQKNYIINSDGILEENDETGETGIQFLYNNWEKLKFKKIVGNKESEIRINKLRLLRKLKKEEIFITKFIVIPAFYRDLDWQKASQGIISSDDINTSYSKLINLTSNLNETSFAADFYSLSNNYAIQNLLVNIFEYFTSKLKGKNGLIHASLLGKNIDYSTRSVISCKTFKSNRWDEELVSYEYTGIPIAQAVSLFFPFVETIIQQRIMEEMETHSNVYSMAAEEQKQLFFHKDAYLDFSPIEIKKRLTRFIRNPESRLDIIKVRNEKNEYVPLNIYYGSLGHSCSWLELLYIYLEEFILPQKHILVTRYPLTNYQNMFFSKISVLTTVLTKKQEILNMREFKYFPNIDDKENIEFIDTLVMSNNYLKSLGADFDGTNCSINVWSFNFLNTKQ
jgi:DNA-directed RNA polymerase beta' subunit